MILDTPFSDGSRQLLFIPRDGSAAECQKYCASEVEETFGGAQLTELNHDGQTSGDDGLWIDMVWAALHYARMADAAAARKGAPKKAAASRAFPLQRGPKLVSCASARCGTPRMADRPFCKAHWDMLPLNMRKEMVFAERHGWKQSLRDMMVEAKRVIAAQGRG